MRFRRANTFGFLALVLIGIGGCRGYSIGEHRVEPSQTRSLREDMRHSWNAGETPESWRKHPPEVEVQEPEWQQKANLSENVIIDDWHKNRPAASQASRGTSIEG